jgi:hypothetical protein
MDNLSRVSSQPEDGQRGQSFQSIEHLLADWLAGARLAEALRVVQQVKAELSRRGVVLSWSVSQVQVEGPCRADEPRPTT